MPQNKPDPKTDQDEQALDEQALEQVSGGARATTTTRKKVHGGDDDLEDLEVER